MRYLGSKSKLLCSIRAAVDKHGISTGTFFDAFAGTGCVSNEFKLDFNVIACDLLHVCSSVTKCQIAYSKETLTFNGLRSLAWWNNDTEVLENVFGHLNMAESSAGFITSTFTPIGSRMYFTEENGMRIDTITRIIYEWKDSGSITSDELDYLMGCLVESVSLVANISGTYGAFNKQWDPRSLNTLTMKNHFDLVRTNHKHSVLTGDSKESIRTIPHDILYLDPPYNSRQYGSYYHVLETIVRNDRPTVHGKTGLRDWKDTKSKFCKHDTAVSELRDILACTSARLVVMSYNNEGILSRNEIETLLNTFGEVTCTEIEHVRYSTESSGKSKTVEYIFTSIRRMPIVSIPSYLNKITCEDCIVGMSRVPDKSIDMILTDLPYGLTECRWDSIIPLKDLWSQYTRIIKPSGAIVLFGQQPFTSQLITSNLDMFKYSLVWKKSKTGNFAQAPYRFLCEHEDILVFSYGKTAKNGVPRMKFNPQGTLPCNKHMKGKNGKTEHREGRSTQNDYVQTVTNYPRSILSFGNEGKPLHPTQKPVDLCEYLIRSYTDEGDTVLDSCMGSGTTAAACIKTKRNFVGYEIDPKNFELCRKRIGDHTVGKEC